MGNIDDWLGIVILYGGFISVTSLSLFLLFFGKSEKLILIFPASTLITTVILTVKFIYDANLLPFVRKVDGSIVITDIMRLFMVSDHIQHLERGFGNAVFFFFAVMLYCVLFLILYFRKNTKRVEC